MECLASQKWWHFTNTSSFYLEGKPKNIVHICVHTHADIHKVQTKSGLQGAKVSESPLLHIRKCGNSLVCGRLVMLSVSPDWMFLIDNVHLEQLR